MVTIPKEEPKTAAADEPKNNTVIMSTPQVKTEDIIIEHDDATPAVNAAPVAVRKQKDDPLETMRKQMEQSEQAVKDERERRISAEHERDAARNQVNTTKTELVKSENEKLVNQELAINSHFNDTKTAVENAERALEEAIDTGKTAKEQITLQKNLAEAVYKMKGAETAKVRFDNWKEQQKNKPALKAVQQDDSITPAARKWIDEHPRFNTDKKYKRVAVAAHEDAIDDGVAADSTEYFRRINTALVESGLEGDTAVIHTPVKQTSGTSTAAPVSQNSTGAGANGGNAAEEQRTGRRTFKLDGNMREQALKIYGKNSSFKLSDDEAYKRYAARQIEIRDMRKNGERI